jgi:hypothetical protein
MKRLIFVCALLLLLIPPGSAAPPSSPCTQANQPSSECDPINNSNPLPVVAIQYPVGSTALASAGTGTTGAVTATLAGASGKTTYICGFSVSGVGGSAALGPITITNLIGSTTFTFQLTSSTGGSVLTQAFRPCIPASGTNTSVAVSTTADGTASAVDVNSWGFQL